MVLSNDLDGKGIFHKKDLKSRFPRFIKLFIQKKKKNTLVDNVVLRLYLFNDNYCYGILIPLQNLQ